MNVNQPGKVERLPLPHTPDAPTHKYLLGELPDGLDEVAVGVGVPRDGLAHAGDHLEGVEVVGLAREGQGDVGEFEAEEAPALFEHAEGLGEGMAAVGFCGCVGGGGGG